MKAFFSILLSLIFCAAPAMASVSVNVNGSAYTIPQNNEKGWGTAVTSWIQAMSQYTLQPIGGAFTLTAEVDTGATYGFKVPYIKTESLLPATAGVLRLSKSDSIAFRNNANAGDLLLGINASDQLTFTGGIVATSSSGAFSDSGFNVYNNSDNTKKIVLDVSGVTTGTTRTLGVPDKSTTLVGNDATQTLTNKTWAIGSNTFTGQLPVANGGTGQLTLTSHGVLVGAGTSSITQLATGSAGQMLQSGGASADPSYSTPTYPSTSGTIGKILRSDGTNNVYSGFTIPDSGTSGGVPYYSSSSAISSSGALTQYNVVIGGGAAAAPYPLGSLGNSGDVLTSSGAGANPTWAAPTAAPTSTTQLNNLGLSNSVTSSALTVLIKQADGSSDATAGSPVKVAMRSSTATNGNYNVRSISGALSLVLSSKTTLGMVASQNNNLWVYLIDSDGAGTMKVGLSTVRYDENQLISTVAESFTGTVTLASPGVWTANGHNLNNNDAVTLTTTGALPTGLAIATTYFVVNKATNTFQLSATPGGAAINTSVSQSGTHTVHVANYRMVSDAAYTNMPFRLVGRGTYNLVTAGTWLVATVLTPGSGDTLPQEVIAAKLYSTGGGTYTSTNVTKVPYTTVGTDTHGATFAAVGNNFIAPVAGIYHVYASISITGGTSAVNAAHTIAVFVNGSSPVGSTMTLIAQAAAAFSIVPTVETSVQLAQGDILDVRLTATASGTLTFGTGNGGNFLNVIKNQGMLP